MPWVLDTAHSEVNFAVRHMMISTVRGHFSSFAGEVAVDGADAGSLRITGTVDVDSISTRNADRDGHLRSPDFFDAASHPQITFESTAVQASGSAVTVTGSLTIRGNTHPITLSGTVEGPARDPWGNQRVGVSLEGEISREDFGLTWNQALETGGVLVGKKVRISVDLQAIQQG